MDCLDPVHSGRMVLGTVRREAGAHERWPKGLKTKQAGGGHRAPVHSDYMVLVMARQ
jgi:hypothetical protein